MDNMSYELSIIVLQVALSLIILLLIPTYNNVTNIMKGGDKNYRGYN